jgi:hypothetical protein
VFKNSDRERDMGEPELTAATIIRIHSTVTATSHFAKREAYNLRTGCQRTEPMSRQCLRVGIPLTDSLGYNGAPDLSGSMF